MTMKAEQLSGLPGEREAYDELCAYTLTHGDPRFIHQHVVDAFAAQHATPKSKPIGVTFALAGLYLHLEKGFTGREVQRAHMQMARQKREWPKWILPSSRGIITAIGVLAKAKGPERDHAIDAWCKSVWSAFAPANRDLVIQLLAHYRLD
jgi:uncharacterized protein DUF5946